MARITEFLGIDRPVVRPGFTVNERAGSMPVCSTCGALVSYETQDLHVRWHASLDAAGSQPQR